MASAPIDKQKTYTAVAGVTFVLAVRGPLVLTAGFVPARDRH